MTSSTSKKKILNYGFSIIELLVVLSIFLIITSITLFKQSRFSSDLLVTNLAYEVALSIREMQVYGIGSKAVSADLVSEQGLSLSDEERRRSAYGVHFSKISGQSIGSFLTFADVLGSDLDGYDDHVYNIGSDPILNTINIGREQKVRKFCVYNGSSYQCSDRGEVDFLDISFVKPNPDALIYSGVAPDFDSYNEALIIVESTLGDKCRAIKVTSPGQISVEPQITNACDIYDGL